MWKALWGQGVGRRRSCHLRWGPRVKASAPSPPRGVPGPSVGPRQPGNRHRSLRSRPRGWRRRRSEGGRAPGGRRPRRPACGKGRLLSRRWNPGRSLPCARLGWPAARALSSGGFSEDSFSTSVSRVCLHLPFLPDSVGEEKSPRQFRQNSD